MNFKLLNLKSLIPQKVSFAGSLRPLLGQVALSGRRGLNLSSCFFLLESLNP